MPENTISLDTQTSSVTVYPDRARVVRTGQARLEAGRQRLEVGDLPLALVPDSVRAAGRGTAKAKLLGVTTRHEQFVETPAAKARELEQAIQHSEDHDSELIAQSGVIEKEQKHLDGLAAQSEIYARGLALRGRTPQEQAALFDFVSGRSRALQTELLALGRQRRELARELDRLRRELKALGSARPKQRYTAVVELDVSEAGDLRLELVYVVAGASWQPLYDLRLVERTIELTYLAQVAQNTGEDWAQVALTLSTARPSMSLAIPELAPWYIRPRPPLRAMQSRSLLRMAGAVAMPASVAMQPAPAATPVAVAPQLAEEELAADSAEVSEAGATLSYGITGTADVPGNNEPRKVTLANLNFQPGFTYVTAPKLEAVCYRRAEIKNDSRYSLLPGALQLFEGDEYLGATALEFVAPGQTFEVALGVDERLRVEREMLARDVDKAFIIGDRRRIRYAFQIELENLRDGPQTVVVRDQIPVSRDEQIKVKLEAAEPRATGQTELNGLEWKLTLEPGAKRRIRFDFSVEHPRTMDVMGLL